jgi:uncharacterized membrane protein
MARSITHLPALWRLGVGIIAALIAAWLSPAHWKVEMRLVASWDGFAVMELFLFWFSILRLQPAHIRRMARVEDPGRTISLFLVVLGASASLLSVVVLLQSSVTMKDVAKGGAIALAISAVVLAWLLIHTVFSLRYARLYYGPDDCAKGLDFPGNNDCPEYLDFVYFAFVIGMTAQTADVGIVSSRMRRNVLMHGMISFGFNTAVVALSIGALTTLL